MWSPTDIVTLIAAIGSVVVSIIAAMKGAAAGASLNSHAQQLDNINDRLNIHGQQINQLSTNSLPAAVLPRRAALVNEQTRGFTDSMALVCEDANPSFRS